MLTFSEAIHQELRGHGVTVTALAPGPVETEFWEIAGWQVGGGQSFEKAVPAPARLITAEDAARAGVRGLESGGRVVVPGPAVPRGDARPRATCRTRSSCRRSSA